MKKVGIIIFCVLFCWVVALMCVPNTVNSNPLVYGETYWCLKCHDAGYPDGQLHTAEMDATCGDCHVDGTPEKWNVPTHKCRACHPRSNPDESGCDLPLFHENFTGPDAEGINCLLCHQKCEDWGERSS